MTHVVTQNCCIDGACIDVCPVNCIHPTPADDSFASAEMVFIDPAVCIDCGACADICPVGAITSDYDIEEADRGFIEVNSAFFSQPGAHDYVARRPDRDFAPLVVAPSPSLDIAIVGTGPAACYAAWELLDRVSGGLQIDMFERLLTPGGLARFGVAPDHLRTRAITERFEPLFDDPRVTVHFGVDVGRDIGAADLAASYDAVIYAVGAGAARPLNIVGETLAGSHSATEFVGWYNGHPDHADAQVDLSCERAIVIGNGNVALDIARILAQDPARLHGSDIAEHALEALRASRLREVVVVGRRDPLNAAFTLPELIGLRDHVDFALWTDVPIDITAALLNAPQAHAATWSARRKLGEIHGLPRNPGSAKKSIRLSFLRSPEAIIGEARATALRQRINMLHIDRGGDAVRIEPTDATLVEDAGLIVRAAGFRGEAIPGVVFDEARGAIPQADGRVCDPATGAVQRGIYVTGWIKRGPSGSMGTNKNCARATVAALLDDLAAGRLDKGPGRSARPPLQLPEHMTLGDWRTIDRHERDRGRTSGRPRVKLVDALEMRRIARPKGQ